MGPAVRLLPGCPVVRHTEQKCGTFCAGWGIVGCPADALRDEWDGSIAITVLTDLSKLLCSIYDINIFTMIWYLYVYVFMLYLCHVTVLWNAYLFGPKWSINYYYYHDLVAAIENWTPGPGQHCLPISF